MKRRRFVRENEKPDPKKRFARQVVPQRMWFGKIRHAPEYPRFARHNC